MDELSADTEAAMEGAVNAEFFAASMVGLQDTFDALLDDVTRAAGWPEAGYSRFKFKLSPDIGIIEKNGVALAEDEQEGVSDIVVTDNGASDQFAHSWEAARNINF